MGAVGKDKYSDILESKASEFGLVVKYQHHDIEPTGEYEIDHFSFLDIKECIRNPYYKNQIDSGSPMVL